MIETVDNLVQLIVTGLCTASALVFALRAKARVWALLGLFSGIFFLGDLYWFLYLFFYDETPPFSFISYFSWYTSYLFLLLLLLFIRQEEGLFHVSTSFRKLFWIVPVFTSGMCAFYMTYGDYLSNIITAVLMTGLIWHSIDGLLYLRGKPAEQGRRKYLYMVTLLFCFAEYALWSSSCFEEGSIIAGVYYWFDYLLSLTFVLFLPALRKAVTR